MMSPAKGPRLKADQKDPLSEEIAGAVWLERRFPSDFVVDRPYGVQHQDLLFLHFRNPVILRAGGAAEREAPARSCIFLTPGTPHFFKSAGKEPLSYDGMYLPVSVQTALADLQLPVNTGFQPMRTDFIPFMLNQLKNEAAAQRRQWEAVSEGIISLMLLLLARYQEDQNSPDAGAIDADLRNRLIEMVRHIEEDPAESWTVEQMAARVNLSRSRYSHVFTNLFGESPRDYVIHARLRYAVILLTNTSLNVAEIAERSGFHSPYYFSRIFAKRIGCPPSKYNDRFVIP